MIGYGYVVQVTALATVHPLVDVLLCSDTHPRAFQGFFQDFAQGEAK